MSQNTSQKQPCHVGLSGLAVMGQNLARNIARHGFPIAVHNRTTAKTQAFIEEFGSEGDFRFSSSTAEFVGAIDQPRSIIIMVKAGQPVDDVIDELVPLLDEDDLIIDAGNSHYTDTARRCEYLAKKNIRFLGTGVSGGEEGALNGPSIMPGGSLDAYKRVEVVLTAISAHVDDEPCCSYVGDGAAGHYVKMVHNGIEYADMQLIAEAYDILRRGLGLTNAELAEVFSKWNSGDLDSFLIEITAHIMTVKDDLNDGPGCGELLDVIQDVAAQKGTGKWTGQSALDLASPATVITDAVYARAISSMKTERVNAANVLRGVNESNVIELGDISRAQFVQAVRTALFVSKIVSYAQGFALLSTASQHFDWKLQLGTIASLWRGGCIIRARFLNRITEAYARNSELTNLMLDPYFSQQLNDAQVAWRAVVTAAIGAGIPTPAFSAALAYYDSYRSQRLPANLIQAQRDLFGAHTYERTDREGTFHSAW